MSLNELTKLAADYCSDGFFANIWTQCYPTARDMQTYNITIGQQCIDCGNAAQNSGFIKIAAGLAIAGIATSLIAGGYEKYLNKKRQ